MTPLRQRMLEDMRIRNLAENTQLSYVRQVACFATYFHRSPEELGTEEIRAYQVYLLETRCLAPSSISLAAGALRFLYKERQRLCTAHDKVELIDGSILEIP